MYNDDPADMIEGLARSPAKDRVALHDYTVADPYDLAPVDKLLAGAVDNALSALEPGETLVILLGENHSMPAHQMAQVGLLDHLSRNISNTARDEPQRPDSFLLAAEVAYDFIINLAQQGYGLVADETLAPSMLSLDTGGQIALSAFCACDDLNGAGMAAHKTLFKAALEKKVSTLFNDLAADEEERVRIDNPYLQEAVLHLKSAAGFDIDLGEALPEMWSDEGLALRNAAMVAQAVKKAQDEGHRVIVQTCGNYHVFGGGPDYPYEYSLAAQYESAGCKVLPVCFEHDMDDPFVDIVSTKCWHRHAEAVVIRGLSAESFEGDDAPAESEKEFIEKLKRAHSGERCPFDDKGQQKTGTGYHAARDALNMLVKKAGKPHLGTASAFSS